MIAARAVHGSDHESLTQAARSLAAQRFPAPDESPASYPLRVSCQRQDVARLTIHSHAPVTDGPAITPADADQAARLNAGLASADALVVCLPADKLFATSSATAATEGLLTLVLKVRTALSERAAPTPVVFALTRCSAIPATPGLTAALRPVHQLLADIASMDHAIAAVIGLDIAGGSVDTAAPLLWCLRHASSDHPRRPPQPPHATARHAAPAPLQENRTGRVSARPGVPIAVRAGIAAAATVGAVMASRFADSSPGSDTAAMKTREKQAPAADVMPGRGPALSADYTSRIDELLSRTSIAALALPAEASGTHHERT